MPPAKDIYFFDQYYEKGLAWYLSHFQQAGNAHAVGELSHDYYFSPEAPARIHEALPGVKLICCLREPVSRLRSGYAYNKTTHVTRDVSLEAYARREAIMIQFDYYGHLKRYVDLFGRDRLLVVFYEDLQRDPADFIRTIYQYLDVDDAFRPSSLNEQINPARNARDESLALFAYRAAHVMRGLGMANLVGRVKQSALLNRVLYKPKAREELADEVLPDDIVQDFRKDHVRLEALLGRSLPASWYG